MITIFSWLGAIIAIIANYLAIKKLSYAPIIWCVGTGILLIVSMLKLDWSNVFLFSIYQLLNIKMTIEWNKKDKKNRRTYLK